MTGKLDGKVAVITGGSRGIGLAIATRFVEEGARVALTGRDADELRVAVEGLGGAALAVPGSVTDAGAAERTLAAAAEAFGPVDILVNNAGRSTQHGPLIEADLDDVDGVWATNLRAPLAWSQAAWRGDMSERGGVILNIASVSGIDPMVGVGAYSISKAGLIHMTRALAAELGPKVRVNAVAPAGVRTRLAARIFEHEAALAARHPLRRLGEPDDLADPALLLVTATWMTGTTLLLDGGAYAARQ